MHRALLIGSQTGGLTGVHADVELLAEVLRGLGMNTECATGPQASLAGTLERYDGLIEDTASTDAAVVYYAGHGGRLALPDQSRHLPFVVPTDAGRDDGEGFLLADELSALQWRLTEKTRNVTVVLDCCHSARMSRNADGRPRATDLFAVPRERALARREKALAEIDAAGLDANPHAVRVVACATDQSAFEGWSSALGAHHGALTAALALVLRQTAAGQPTWHDVLEVVRARVRASFDPQRSEVEGPADRVLFSLERRDESGVLPVRVVGGTALIENAVLFGLAPGDRYELVAPASRSLGPATVARVSAGAAVLELRGVTPDELPGGTRARPVDVALGRRAVAVLPTSAPDRDEIVAELQRSTALQPVDDAADAFASLRLDSGAVQILDAVGEALYATP